MSHFVNGMKKNSLESRLLSYSLNIHFIIHVHNGPTTVHLGVYITPDTLKKVCGISFIVIKFGVQSSKTDCFACSLHDAAAVVVVVVLTTRE